MTIEPSLAPTMEENLPTTLSDWLDDLSVRFLLNCPPSELSSMPRLCFQVEEAQWFYEDFVRPAVASSGAPPLPGLSLREFLLRLFQHCPLFSGYTNEQHLKAFEEFMAYKVRVPVRGAIMLDERMEKVVLVRGWKKGASWSFPRGKINKDEPDLDCAVREVWEETGFDIRAAGLVPEDDEDTKYIDITMRDQQVRLFVFRGIPEDTHFEPKTRKEISKIQWYNIKDLPGFKKQKAGQGNEAANANKFYMVAPFLGHLKKWIGQQRRNDAEHGKRKSATIGYPATTEDESEFDEESGPDRLSGVDVRSEELKKLLSIGGLPSAAAPTSQQQQPSQATSGSANLLAMLQRGAKPTNGIQNPRTPFEQTTFIPPHPESPNPHHIRQPPSSGQQHYSPPRFPFPPPHVQDGSGRHQSLPTPNVFGSQSGFPPSSQQPHGPPKMTPQLSHQQHHPPNRQSLPPGPPPGFLPPGQHNGNATVPFNTQQQSPMRQPPPHMLPPHMQQPPRPQMPPQGPFMAPQGPYDGPIAPSASQLPAPSQLGVDKMRLLDAFKTPVSGAPATASPSQTKQRPASSHQTALLDLFRKPSGAGQSQGMQQSNAQSMEGSNEPPEPASPTGTDVTVKPSTSRRATLNEITRTLPVAKPKIRSPEPMLEQQSQSPAVRPSVPTGPRATQSKSQPGPPTERQLFDPANPMKYKPANLTQCSKAESPAGQTRKTPAPSESPRIAPNGHQASQNGNRGTPPPYTILARPASSRDIPKSPTARAKVSSGPTPPTPLKNDSSKPVFQPQVLKRPKEEDVEGEQVADKKDQLLALFGKTTPITSPPPAASSPGPAPQMQRQEAADDKKNRLLDLFNTSSSNVSTPTAGPSHATPQAPPPAPKIEPEHRPTSAQQQRSTNTTTAATTKSNPNTQHSMLLDLFNSKRQGTPVTSPGTPISPFTLGTPAVEEQNGGKISSGPGLGMGAGGDGDGRVKSPQEQKEFLMSFLNGVVQGEGRK